MFAALLLVGVLQTQGDLELALDACVQPSESAGAALELSYDIPFGSLAFLRGPTGYSARFSLGVQVLDSRGNPVAGDVWQRVVEVADYALTVGGDSSITGTVSLPLPTGASRAEVEVLDLSSDRSARAGFDVSQTAAGILVRLCRAGRPYPSRVYALGDTVEAMVEVPGSEQGVDSFQFRLKEGTRVVADAVRATEDAGGNKRAEWSFPIADSAGKARLSGGCSVEVTARGREELRGRADFRVEVPFFLDDDAYVRKVDELLYAATSQEINRLRALPAGEREEAWREFWQAKDPTPTTERNEEEEEYFERIEYAKENFGRGDRGYRSDRARVYVHYGQPDHIDSRPFEIDVRAYEVWSYYGLGLEFRFVDRHGFGEYALENPRMLGDY